MTFQNAAEEVLRSVKGTPMMAEEITDEATRRESPGDARQDAVVHDDGDAV